MSRPGGRRWRVGLCLVAVLLAAAWWARPVLLPPLARFLDVSEPPRRVDYVLTLGGGHNSRPFAAAALIRRGLADQALLVEIAPSPAVADGFAAPEHELNRAVLLARGVPEQAVTLLPGKATSTLDEALALARFLDDQPGKTVGIVTTDYHTRRARMLFRRVLPDRGGDLVFLAVPHEHVHADNWWRSEEGLHAYLGEYCKLLYYLVR